MVKHRFQLSGIKDYTIYVRQASDVVLFQDDLRGAVINMQQRFYSWITIKTCSFCATINEKRMKLEDKSGIALEITTNNRLYILQNK